MSATPSSANLSSSSSGSNRKRGTRPLRRGKTYALPLHLRSSKSSRTLLPSPLRPATQLICWRLAAREDAPKPRLRSASRCRNSVWTQYRRRRTGSVSWNKNSQPARGSFSPLSRPRMWSDRWSMQVSLSNRKTDRSAWTMLERLRRRVHLCVPKFSVLTLVHCVFFNLYLSFETILSLYIQFITQLPSPGATLLYLVDWFLRKSG